MDHVLLDSTELQPSRTIDPGMAPGWSTIYHPSPLDSGFDLQSPKGPASEASNYYKNVPATHISTDPTLTALAQLGLYRSGCRRAFVTILDEHRPCVVAEATNTPPPTDRESEEAGSLVGATTLGLRIEADSFSDTANVTTDDTCLIIRDTSLENSLKNEPWVERCPQVRFYAEVALRARSGEVFGTYGVLDDGSHPSFGAHELASLHEVAGFVATHLENTWIVEHSHRTASRLGALFALARVQDYFKETDQKPCKRGSTTHSYPSPYFSSLPEIEHLSVSGTASSHTLESQPGQPAHNASEHGNDVSPRETHQPQGRKCSELSDNSLHITEPASIHDRNFRFFTYASSLLQNCMGVDGVLFLDAPRIKSRRSSCANTDWDGSPIDTDSCHSHWRQGLSSHGEWPEKLCEPLSSAVSERYSRNGYENPTHTITEELLHEMFAAFPHGEILGNPESAKAGDSCHPTAASRLLQGFPDARSVLFLPLWRWDKSRFLAAAVVWTCHEDRKFVEDDLSYLRAFGDAMVSELAQLDRAATEKTKSDFLSSISHELRSPLHGMLANSELLQSTALQPAQRDMVKMVERCGLTLLDTMNHLLDYTKINNLKNVHTRSSIPQKQTDHLTAEFDLDILVEDVTESLYAGHRSHLKASKIACRYLPDATGLGNKLASSEHNKLDNTGDLAVIVRVEERQSWRIRSISGRWRLIIMNLLGNAFKYTQSGFIEVSLSQNDRHNGFRSTSVHLAITDTGCGISREFLESKLFTPFSQENTLCEGVGLGLSIAHQLVSDLGGHIDIKSDIGVGTQVDVYIPLDFVKAEPKPQVSDQSNCSGTGILKRACLVGMNLDADLREAKRGQLSMHLKRKLSIRGAISNALLSQPGWMLSFADSLDRESGHVAVIEEATLKSIAEEGPIKAGFRSVVVLGEHGVSIPGNFTIEGADVVYVRQPLIPKKIIQALQRLAESKPRLGSKYESLIVGPMQGNPTRRSSLPEAFAAAKTSESPPVVGENVSLLSTPSPKGSSPSDLHVLIVDDNDINLKVLSTFMRKIGCSYETASNGLAALEKYKNSPRVFNYVLMDISMPVMDGITASNEIREYEAQHSLPRSSIMAVTGVASTEMQQQAIAAGIDDYLVKPLSLHDLKRTMNLT